MPQLNSGCDTDSSDDNSVYDNHLNHVILFQQNEVTHNIPGGTVHNLVAIVEIPYNIVLALDLLMTSLK